MRKWKIRLLAFVGVLVVFYVGACAYIWGNQVEMTFLPMETIYTTPGRMGMEYEEVRIPVGSSPDEGEFHGFWVPSDDMFK